MSNIQLFENTELQVSVRTTVIDGEPWFVAKDVCEFLDTDTSNVRRILDEDEVAELSAEDSIHIGSNGEPDNISDPSNGGKAPLIVSEPGFYTLVLRSRKPVAKVFRRWVTHEVLPTIRKTGEFKMRKEYEKTIKSLEHDVDFAFESSGKAWAEVRRIRNEYSKYMYAIQGKYYTMWNTPYYVGDRSRCIYQMNELSHELGIAIKVDKENQYAWHKDVWLEREKRCMH